jgi:hypothetical protein
MKFVNIAAASLLLLGGALVAEGKTDSAAEKTAAAAKPSNSTDWTAAKGWNGLVVGKSTLKQAEARLGKLYNTEKVAGSKSYNFKEALVNIFIDEKTKVITKIWVSGDLKHPTVPKTISEAMKMYGELGNKGPTGSGGDMYAKPGLSMMSSPKGPPDGVAWLEFSRVK